MNLYDTSTTSVVTYMHTLLGDSGDSKEETDNLQDTTVTKNDRGSHHSQEGEYRLPLVWIDLEMTGRYLVHF